MKALSAVTIAAGLAAALAGCGTAVPSPHHHPQAAGKASSPPVSSSPSASPASSAVANERLFMDALAQSIPVIPGRVVAGPLMRAYTRDQHAQGAAWSAAGQPDATASITQIADGYKMCSTSNGSTSCERFTHFTADSSGRITGMSVDGEPVAGRIATAPAATSDGLTISDVTAYRLTRQNIVFVAFRLTDTSYRPPYQSPALIGTLSGASDNSNWNALPNYLAPGDTIYAGDGFGITQARSEEHTSELQSQFHLVCRL